VLQHIWHQLRRKQDFHLHSTRSSSSSCCQFHRRFASSFYTHTDLKSAKDTDDFDSLFVPLGSACVRAVRKNVGENDTCSPFTNIFMSSFCVHIIWLLFNRHVQNYFFSGRKTFFSGRKTFFSCIIFPVEKLLFPVLYLFCQVKKLFIR